MAKKVYIGVGHGGSDPGAVANGFKEKDLNLAIALACQEELARHGVLVKIGRNEDTDRSLTATINECNAFAPDLAADIHNNAGGGDGAEVYHTIGGGTGKTLAVNILDEVVKIGQNSRGAKTKKNSSGSDYFGFIRQTNAPAVIVECAFVDNRTDMQIIDTTAEQIAMGKAIAKGMLKTMGVAYQPENPVVEQSSTPGTLYRVQVGAYGVRANAEAMQKKLKAAGYEAIIVEVKNVRRTT
jgi:N-acetylmuramoyl-L-alanine amidase